MGIKQPQCLVCSAVLVHHTVQHSGVACHHKVQIVLLIRWDIGLLGPCLVLATKATIPLLLLEGIGQYPGCPLVSKLLKNITQAIVIQIGTVVVLPNSLLDRLLASDILQMAGPPEGQLILSAGIFCRPAVQIGITHGLRPPDTSAAPTAPNRLRPSTEN